MIEKLFKRVEIAPLVFFRILGGTLITLELIGEALTDFAEPYVETTFHFSYMLTPWLAPGPPALVYAHMATNVLAAIFVTLGLHYRAATLVLTVGLSTLFLMERSAYINHTYLYCLFAGILTCIPANAAVSFDAKRRPEIERDTVSAWTVYLLRFQIGVVYVFAGLAKLEPDWLNALPLTKWLADRSAYPVIGPLLAMPGAPYFMSYAGLVLDLSIVPAMLWGKTRRYAFALIVAFHLINVATFGIGTFPWFSIVATALFFPPASFRNLSILRSRLPTPKQHPKTTHQTAIALALAAFVLIQIAVPSRRFFYEGRTSWTEAGHTFAWRMMLRTKRGRLVYRVRDLDTGEQWTEHARQYLTPTQLSETAGDPDMILQLAHHIRDQHAARGRTVAITANAIIWFNGRPGRPFVDSEVDLTKVPRRHGRYDFVLPFDDSSG
jgi:vitamin K-dependent gamma-carboxylase